MSLRAVARFGRRGTPAVTSQVCTVWGATLNRFATAAIVSPSSTYSLHRVAASGLTADPGTASESAIPQQPPDRAARPRSGSVMDAVPGHLADIPPHSAVTRHAGEARRSVQSRVQIT